MGEEMYLLHDNGRELFTSPQDCTPMQRFVYVLAKNHHSEDPQQSKPKPGGLEKAKRFNDATANI
jgi:hypothetical protein